MEPFTLFHLFCLVAGAIIVWLILKLFYEKNYVSTQELEAWKLKFQEAATAKAVSEGLLGAIKDDLVKTQTALEGRNKEVERLIGELSVKTEECGSLELDKNDLRVEINNLKGDLDVKSSELQRATGTIVGLHEKMKYTEEKLETQKAEIENIGQKFEATFKVMAASILEDKSQKFSEQQETNLKSMLQPLKENIAAFRQELENRSRNEANERTSLQEQVKQLALQSNSISQQANNLAEALRGNVKMQGTWGERILERMLEHSGLQKGVHYLLQEKSYNEDGKGIQPDAIIKLPGNRNVVIDSKVSLAHYTSYCASKSINEQEQLLKQLTGSVKAHIDGLSTKNYYQVQDALDMVIMFVPVEGAYIAAMNADCQLWEYAYGKGILLISPSNLLLALKLIYDMWQKDSVDKNAQAIATLAGKMYDKLAGVVDSFENVGKSMQQAQNHYQKAWNQLKDGRGNIVSQAEQMKKLHIKAKKNLPAKLVEDALLEDGIELPEEDEPPFSLFTDKVGINS
jgi:DNA recombination protein RmuC